MSIFLGFLGIGFGFFLIKYRERIGDFLGDAYWMRYVGGVYNLIIIVGVLIFFWSVALMTGTQTIFFAPLYWILGGAFS